MSYEDKYLESCPQGGDRMDEDEAMAAMLDMDLDEYLMGKSIDRHLRREHLDEDDELPF